MYRYILCVCAAMLMHDVSSIAQTPTYQFSAFTGTNSPAVPAGQDFIEQSIYTRSSFPTMPAGRVKAIYFRIADPYSVSPNVGNKCALQQFIARVGYVADSAYKLNPIDSFKTGLTTIYGPDTFFVPCSAVGGAWIKVPVKKGNFWYDPERKFAVELVAGPAIGNWNGPLLIANSSPAAGYKRTLYAVDHNARTGGTGNSGMDLGIDLGNPDDVEGFSNITSFGLFPNPATDGRFNVSFEAAQRAKEVIIIVSDATGREIYQRRYANPGTRFFEEVQLGQAAKGIYFLKLTADGESLNRRLVLQ